MSKQNTSDSIIVSVSLDLEDKTGVLIVGRKSKLGKIDIINAFQNEEAVALYNKLFIPTKDGQMNRAVMKMHKDPPSETLH